jgi:2'-5' RNA ligase
MRAFIAIGLPPDVAAALEPALGALRKADLPGLRPVATGSTHITLRFLGELSKSRLDSIAGALANVARRSRSFELDLDEVGSFPSKGPPGVLWVGLKGDVAAARRLHAVLEVALTELGHPAEKRAFSPHITLARMFRSAAVPDRMRALEILKASAPGPAVFAIESVNLMASELNRYGPRYQVLATAPFGARAGNA